MEYKDDGNAQTYLRIYENLDKGFQTAPKADGEISKAFLAFLKLAYSSKEAELVQYLDMNTPKTPEEIAALSGKDIEEVNDILSPLVLRAALSSSQKKYSLPFMPSLLNMHMFYPDMKPDDLEAAKLYQQFFIKEKYYKYYGTSEKGTPGLRTIPVNQTIHPESKKLSAEEAHNYINGLGTEDLALVPCPCRVRTEKLEIRECKDKFPIGNCIFIGSSARHFDKIGLGKRVNKEQAIQYLDQMVDLGLVPATDNYIEDPHMIICLCCGCCCSNLRGRTKWDNPTAILPSNFLPEANDDCIECGLCVDRCMLDALTMDEDKGKPVVEADKCIGCGVCAITCPEDALKLHRHDRTTPFQTVFDFYGTVAKDNNRA